MGFHSAPYWDWWALRDTNRFPFNIWGNSAAFPREKRGEKLIRVYQGKMVEAIEAVQQRRCEFVKVDSAFNFLEIIVANKLGNASYRGYEDEDPDMPECEHVPFHQD